MVTLDAHAKINLGLDVLGRRADGYHEVRMVMQTLDLCDTVTLDVISGADAGARTAGERQAKAGNAKRTVSEGKADERGTVGQFEMKNNIHLTITSDDPMIDVSLLPTDGRNLCVKAVEALLADAGVRASVDIHLVKRIPFEAGLAGGSTDAAAVLKGLNELLDLHYTNEELAEIGVKLGADVPYCIYGGAMLAEGIGEELTVIEPSVPALPVLLVKPDFGISTGGIYDRLDAVERPTHPDIDGLLEAVRSGKPRQIAGRLGNILEEVTVAENPKLQEIKTGLVKYGALGALMTGSGPTVFGVFADEETMGAAEVELKKKYNGYFISKTYIC